jgi:hypothetical protein
VDMFQYLTTYDHSLLWRTLRAIFAGGFFTTIHSITDVAAARAYLDKRIRIYCMNGCSGIGYAAYHVKIYCE